MLAGGGFASFAGQNSLAGADWAANEVLNNSVSTKVIGASMDRASMSESEKERYDAEQQTKAVVAINDSGPQETKSGGEVVKGAPVLLTFSTPKSGVPGPNFVPNPDISSPYVRPPDAGPTTSQKASVQGLPCVDCGAVTPNQVADHKVPLVVQYYQDGTVDVNSQRDLNAVQPHCPTCSAIQGGQLGAFGRAMRNFFGF